MISLPPLQSSLATAAFALLLAGCAAGLPGEAGAGYYSHGSELALSVSQRDAVQPWQRGRERAAGSRTFMPPSARPRTDRRPSDYYTPPPRTPEPFYHYDRQVLPPTVPSHQSGRDQFRR